MKLELGKIKINDIQFSDKTYIEKHILYVNKEEVEKLVLEDDKLIGCKLDIAIKKPKGFQTASTVFGFNLNYSF